MTQEDKELLLRDLCARLPYGVKVQDELGRINKLTIGNADLVRLFYNDFSIYGENALSLPLLRPMSSMTEEENKEAKENGCIIYCDTSPEDKGLLVFASPKGFDWLNKKMFDYRKDDEGKTMIEKGLALEAPKGMYNIE